MSARVVLVAAYDSKLGTGLAEGIPWRSRVDLSRFRSLTVGGVCAFGRRTAKGLGLSLEGRANVLLSRAEPRRPVLLDRSGRAFGFARSFEDVARLVIEDLRLDEPVYACGGEGVWREAVEVAQKLGVPCTALVTEVQGDWLCDSRFPFDLRAMNWMTVHEGQWQLESGLTQRFCVFCDKM